MSKVMVYVSGPISKGDMFVNARNAILAGEQLRAAGLFPYVPHLSCTWQMIIPVAYEDWMTLDFAWIERCDVILRLPGDSSGSDREVVHAKTLGKPDFYSVEQVLAWAATRQGRPAGTGRKVNNDFMPCPNCKAFTGHSHAASCPDA